MKKLLAAMAGVTQFGGLAACTTTTTPHQPRIAVRGWSNARSRAFLRWIVRL